MLINEIISNIDSGNLDVKFIDIYIDKERIEYQKNRYKKALTSYKETFGSLSSYSEDVLIVSAPGRTEVGGNHTDHQHGQVLAASINDDAIAIASKNSSDIINVKSEGYDMISFSPNDIDKKDSEEGTTIALIKGVIKGVMDRGFIIGGFDAYITSDVLGGSGLSSSAAFETLIGNILSALYNDMKIDAVTIAIIGQYAENYYFGKPCGLMDQMACSVGSLCHIDFIDPSNPVIERIELDMDKEGYSLCITDTKGSHADLTPDYAAIPSEMKAVANLFGKDVLTDISESDVIDNISDIRSKLGDRALLRALHFFEENKRVPVEAEALKNNDFKTFLSTVKASGDSSYKFLQNVYTNHDPEHQNVSIALCISEMVLQNDGGVCRVHGGGFAGTIQAFVRNEKVNEYKAALDKVFGNGACAVLKIRKYGGILVLGA
ncbi:MAG: galactokinase [Eubacterium sp.]|nr:galactokinase [Eubacterium sp.]